MWETLLEFADKYNLGMIAARAGFILFFAMLMQAIALALGDSEESENT